MSPVPARPAPLHLAVAAAMALGACQQAGNPVATAIEHATRGAEDPGHAGSAAARDALPLPTGFPEDVYLPQGYRVNSVMALPEASVLSLSVPGDVGALFTDARRAMQAEGWTQTVAARHSADTAMLAFEKPAADGARSALLSFNRNHGDQHVILGVQLRRQRQ